MQQINKRMIPLEFTKTNSEYDELKSLNEKEEIEIFKKENPDIGFELDDEYILMKKEEHEGSAKYKLKQKIKKLFSKEYDDLIEQKEYFLGCTYKVYEDTYEERLSVFEKQYEDAEEYNFILEELKALSEYKFLDFIEDDLKRKIKYSIQRTINNLRVKLEGQGYKIENLIDDNGKVKRIAIKDASVVRLAEEPELDFRVNSAKEKIIYLELIGFFDFIQDKQPELKVSNIASLLSAFTGENAGTIQSYINPILSKDVSQKNNPLTNISNVESVKERLLNIGLVKLKKIGKPRYA